jgi:deoxyribodipyrimidine photo-lyase
VTPAARMSNSRILVYVMRRDLRVSDNPILDSILKNGTHDFTHLLPVYVFAAQQVEVSGFIPKDGGKSPYPEARSQVGAFWRCGPHRAKFLAESVWDLKSGFEKLGSGLCIRVGMIDEVVKSLIDGFNDQENNKVSAVWMTADEGVEEIREERATRRVCEKSGVQFKLWQDEKYLVDEYVMVCVIPHPTS